MMVASLLLNNQLFEKAKKLSSETVCTIRATTKLIFSTKPFHSVFEFLDI